MPGNALFKEKRKKGQTKTSAGFSGKNWVEVEKENRKRAWSRPTSTQIRASCPEGHLLFYWVKIPCFAGFVSCCWSS